MTAIRVNESSGSVGSLQIADGYGGFLSGSIIAGSNITIQDDGSGNFTIVGTGGSVIPSGDSNATYLVLSTTSSLSNERSLVPSAGLIGVDQGANSNYLLSVDDSVVATLTSSVSFPNGISGSLTQLSDGTSYLIEGDNITIASSSNGSITISSVDTNTEYTAGTGLTLDSTTFNINDSIVATLTGSVFSGNIVAQSGLSGSLQQLADGSSYLVAGENITIVTGSNGQIIISSVTDTGASVTNRIRNNYIVIEDVLSGSFFTANNSNFEEVNYDKELIDVFLNGQLQISGSDTQVGNSEADYHIFSSTQFKFGFDVFKDDIITVLTYPSTTNLERNKSDYILSSDVLSGSAITVSNNDFSIAASNSTLIDVYRNGQLLLSGTDAQVGNLEADYLIQSTNQIKLGYDVFKDDVFSVTVFNQSDTDKREKVDYPVNVDVLSGSVFNAASSDFGTANSSTNLIDIYHNGALLYPGTDAQVGNLEADYFFPDTNQIKFGFDIQEDDVVSVTVYRDATETVDAYAKYLVTEATDGLDNERVLTAGTGLQSSDGGAGGSFTISVAKEMVFNEKLGGIVDGSNTLFTLANTPFATSEISIFVNGQLQTPPDLTTWQDYSVTGSNVYFTTGSTPEEGSLILAMYNKVVS